MELWYAGILCALGPLLPSSPLVLSGSLKIRIYENITLPVALYGCEAWSLAVEEQHRLRTLENDRMWGVLRREKEEVTR